MAQFAPVNPNASAEAKQVLAYLYELMDPAQGGLMTGQHNWLEDPTGNITNLVLPLSQGKYPAVSGFEMGPISGQNDATVYSQRAAVAQAAIAYWKSGGIPTIMWHQNYPLTPYTWANVQRIPSQNEFDQCLTPGDPKNNWLLQEYDKVAVHLKTIRDAGVPVLFRPYHENNGYWFWWGSKANYDKLWDLIYNRFVTTHGLNNLIWVWNPNCMKASDPKIVDFRKNTPVFGQYDVLAFDIYLGEFTQSFHDDLFAFGQGKPIAIGECGKLPDMNVMQRSQYRYTWCMAWGNPNFSQENTTQNVTAFYTNAYAVNRDEVKLPDPDDPGPIGPTDPNEIARLFAQRNLPPPAFSVNAAPTFVGQIAIALAATYVAKAINAASDWVPIVGKLLLSDPNGRLWKVYVSPAGEVLFQDPGDPDPDPNPDPEPIFKDDFERANSTTSMGNGWFADYGTWGILNGKAYSVSNVVGNVASRDLGAGNVDYVLSVDVSGTIAGTNDVATPFVLFRYKDISNFLSLHLYNQKFIISKTVGGKESELASGTVGALVNGQVYNLKVEAIGKQLKGYVDGKLIASATLSDADYATFGGNTRIGFKVVWWGKPPTPCRWDNVLAVRPN